VRLVVAQPADGARAAGQAQRHGREYGAGSFRPAVRVSHNTLVVATAHAWPDHRPGILAIGPWSWLFAINIPFGLVAILIGLKTLPRTRRRMPSIFLARCWRQVVLAFSFSGSELRLITRSLGWY
jgi:hypothetical protein